MNEAKGSFNGYFRSAEGNKDQFTLRQEADQSDVDFIQRVSGFVSLLAANGWEPWLKEVEIPASPQQVAETVGGVTTARFFQVDSIKLASGGEHPRWVVMGGKFTKYGVTCWPETLEDAGILEYLDPLKENAPQGTWMAHYVEKKNDKGKDVPDKVVRLEKVKG